MAIEPGADRGAAKREFLQRGNRLLRAPFPETHLLRVTAEFLAEPDRRRVHQMGATDLDHVVEFVRFRRQAQRASLSSAGMRQFLSCSAALMWIADGITSLLD